jgi:hypothetical protein
MPAKVAAKASSAMAASAGEPVPYALLCNAFNEIEQITGRLQITATMTALFAEVRARVCLRVGGRRILQSCYFVRVLFLQSPRSSGALALN